MVISGVTDVRDDQDRRFTDNPFPFLNLLFSLQINYILFELVISGVAEILHLLTMRLGRRQVGGDDSRKIYTAQ